MMLFKILLTIFDLHTAVTAAGSRISCHEKDKYYKVNLLCGLQIHNSPKKNGPQTYFSMGFGNHFLPVIRLQVICLNLMKTNSVTWIKGECNIPFFMFYFYVVCAGPSHLVQGI